MRKMALALLLVVTLFLTPVSPLYAAEGNYAAFTLNEYNYIINGQQISTDSASLLLNNRFYVPVRYLAQALGISADNIFWNGASGTVTLTKATGSGAVYINLTLNSRSLMVVKQNAGQDAQVVVTQTVPMDVAPVIIYGRVYLPVRYVAEALGYIAN